MKYPELLQVLLMLRHTVICVLIDPFHWILPSKLILHFLCKKIDVLNVTWVKMLWPIAANLGAKWTNMLGLINRFDRIYLRGTRYEEHVYNSPFITCKKGESWAKVKIIWSVSYMFKTSIEATNVDVKITNILLPSFICKVMMGPLVVKDDKLRACGYKMI